MKTADRRAELLTALKDQAGASVLVTDDPRQAVAPCILLHPVPSRTYLGTLDDDLVATLSWTVVAMITGVPDAAAADKLDDLQEIVEDALAPQGRLLTARAAAYTVRAEMPANFAIVTTLED